MARIPNSASINEMLDVLKKQWLKAQDIKILASVSLRKAYLIRNEITEDLKKQNYFLPNGLVPSNKVIDYLKLDIKYLRKLAEK